MSSAPASIVRLGRAQIEQVAREAARALGGRRPAAIELDATPSHTYMETLALRRQLEG